VSIIKKNCLIIGQVPPPYHGQSVMIEKIVQLKHDKLKTHFLKMDYSSEIDEVGKFKFRKVIVLIRLLVQAFKMIRREKIDTIYYPPAGTGKIPIYRDIITLLFLKVFKRRIILHFHAMGLQDSYKKLNSLVRYFFRKAYFESDLCICLSEFNVAEIEFLRPKQIKVVPYGTGSVSHNRSQIGSDEKVKILYAGNIIESKGVMVLLNVVDALSKENYELEVSFMGGMTSSNLEKRILEHPAVKKGIAKFLGVTVGENKEACFKNANLFCFPTFYENENFPVVIIEAMQYSLPVLSTKWRGIPSMIDEGNGLLAEPMNEDEFKQNLESLLSDRSKINEMSINSGKRYELLFTEKQFQHNISHAILNLN